ncbi:MAG: ATP-binding cassette domain-containing protein [Burkholderiaceae bacterium]
MLEVRELSCGYGEMTVVHALDLEVAAGRTVALIGANGAGKTSTLMALAGHLSQHHGSIRLDGEPIDALPPMQRVARGIGWVPEGRRLFPDLSVRENLVVGGYVRPRPREAANIERVVALFPRIGERLDQRAGSLGR